MPYESNDMAAVDFLYHKNPQTWARVEPATLGTEEKEFLTTLMHPQKNVYIGGRPSGGPRENFTGTQWYIAGHRKCNTKKDEIAQQSLFCVDNMLTKYQMIKFIDFCEVWFLPESVARVAAIVRDHRCHMPRH
ncbi:hypothetical protein TNCV_786291 [Trichonephila clavipes]|nr:hypothetical protein TNCV_786291 [Trichonephila clavipes]